MVIKRLKNGELTTIFVKLIMWFIAGAVTAIFFWEFLRK